MLWRREMGRSRGAADVTRESGSALFRPATEAVRSRGRGECEKVLHSLSRGLQATLTSKALSLGAARVQVWVAVPQKQLPNTPSLAFDARLRQYCRRKQLHPPAALTAEEPRRAFPKTLYWYRTVLLSVKIGPGQFFIPNHPVEEGGGH